MYLIINDQWDHKRSKQVKCFDGLPSIKTLKDPITMIAKFTQDLLANSKIHIFVKDDISKGCSKYKLF